MENFMEQIWEYIRTHSVSFRQSFSNHIPEITKILIFHFLQEGEIQTGIAYKGKMKYAFVTIDQYDVDSELSIRCHGQNIYDLFFQYYDYDSEGFVNVKHVFTNEEVIELPEGLKSILELTLKTEKTHCINGTQLSEK